MSQAESVLQTFAANVHNDKLSDKDFREFIANSLTLFRSPNKIMLESKNKAGNSVQTNT
jgi:hypothetical protein